MAGVVHDLLLSSEVLQQFRHLAAVLVQTGDVEGPEVLEEVAVSELLVKTDKVEALGALETLVTGELGNGEVEAVFENLDGLGDKFVVHFRGTSNNTMSRCTITRRIRTGSCNL